MTAIASGTAATPSAPAAASNGSAPAKADGAGTQPPAGAAGSAPQTDPKAAAPSMLAGGEEKKDGGKAPEGGASAGAASKETEFAIKLPDGVEVDKDRLTSFTTFAKENGLTPEVASKLVEWSMKEGKAAEATYANAINEQRARDFKTLEDDPEFGKANLKASQLSVRRAVARFFDNATLEKLTALGVDNDPGFVKALKRIGDGLKEDTTAAGGVDGAAAPKAQVDRETLNRNEYPSHFATGN